MFHPIDLQGWEQRDTFTHFMQAGCVYSLTRELCVTAFRRYTKESGLRFFPALTWAVAAAVNSRPEFRLGYDSAGRLGRFDTVHPEYTVLSEETGRMDSLCTAYTHRFPDFYAAMVQDIRRFHMQGLRTAPRENTVLLSCVPWFSYTEVSFRMKDDRIFLRPFIVWGRLTASGGETVLPFTLQIHHAAADGYHCHLFFCYLEELLRCPAEWLG